MSPSRHVSGWLTCFAILCATSTCRAGERTPDPVRLIPASADLVLRIDQPRKLGETILGLEAVQQVKELEGLREFYDSTNYRRLLQLLSHFEKKLGAKDFELLDKVAGGGLALGVKFASPDPGLLLVAQAKDEKLLKKFFALAVEVGEEELARQEVKGALTKAEHRGVKGVHLGKGLFAAIAGSALLVSNKEDTIKAAIDLHLDGDAKSVLKRPAYADGQKLLGPGALASLWLDFEKSREFPQFKVVFDTFTAEPTFALALGGIADAARRSPFLCAGLFEKKDGFEFTLRFPRGRDGMGEIAKLIMPPEGEGSLPPLRPKGTSVSVSYYLDLETAWQNKDKVFNKDAQKGLNELEKNAGLFVGKGSISGLLKNAGKHQRFIYTQQQASSVYTTKPKQSIGAFALVQEMNDPKFAKSLEFSLRSAALLAGFKFNLKLVEEKRGDITLVSYRFSEKTPLKEDPDNYRFNFSPTFGSVGDQFFATSTIELARELADTLPKEAGERKGAPAPGQIWLYASGFAEAMRATQEAFITQAVLAQAMTPEAAKKQVEALTKIVDGLGTLRIESRYGANDARIDFRVVMGKQK